MRFFIFPSIAQLIKAFALGLLTLFVFTSTLSAQTKEEKKMRIKAVKALNAGNYTEAKSIYEDLLKLAPENVDYNYEMGLAYYEEGIHKGKAAKYIQKAIENNKGDTLPDMFLYAGKAEQFAGNYDLAIDYYNDYMMMMRELDGLKPDELEEDIPRYIEMCENGKVQFENNKDYIRIENLGSSINSEYADYSPVVNNDESIILFTSRRDNTTGEKTDVDGKYMEDIYFSLNIDGEWTRASNYDSSNTIMNSAVNTDDHDATITFAADETQLYIYRAEDVWVSNLTDGLWTVPVREDSRINSEKGYEPSVFITQDEQTMFVVSELVSGQGGTDIYITTKGEDGTWKPLENLGDLINTKHDEDAPFLTPDGNTLYFASNGHNSMGDYDIFKSVLDENREWTVPENLGHPINTPGHDRYFVTTDNGAVGFYASDRDGGLGETDIYRIILDCKSVSSTKIRGVVFSEDQQKPVSATIAIYDPETNELIKEFAADSVTGKYEMRLRTEKTYRFRISAEDYLPHSGDFTVPKQCDYYSLFQEIKIDNLEDSSGRVFAQRAYINNAFFNVDQKVTESYQEVDLENIEEAEKDSLRAIVAANYNPMELTNYIQGIDILDPNGVKLATGQFGDTPVEKMQMRDEIDDIFNSYVVEADKNYYNDLLPEARANYMIASTIKPEEEYPKQQIDIINEKLVDAPFEALLARLPEVDTAQLALTLEEEVEEPVETVEEVVEEVVEVAEVAEVEEVVEEVAEEVVEEVVEEEEEVVEAVEEVVEEVKEEVIAEPKEEETIVFRNILFDFDKSDLRAESIKELDKISSYMAAKNNVEVQIDGHADAIGTNEYNMALSERRAKEAYQYVLKSGINEARLTYQFFGEGNPIAPNTKADGTDNPDGRQLNRRCEFKVDQTGTAENVVLKF